MTENINEFQKPGISNKSKKFLAHCLGLLFPTTPEFLGTPTVYLGRPDLLYKRVQTYPKLKPFCVFIHNFLLFFLRSSFYNLTTSLIPDPLDSNDFLKGY